MKKVLTVVLALMLILSMTACGSSPSAEGGTSQEEAPSESGETSDGDAAGDSDKTDPDKTDSSKNSTPVSLSDAKQPADSDFSYDKYNSYVDLRGYKGSEKVIFVPATIEGLPVQCSGLSIESDAVRGVVFAEGFTSIPTIYCRYEGDPAIEAVGIPASCEELESKPSNLFMDFPYMKTIEVAEGNPTYSVEDGILYAMRYENKILLCYPAMREGETFVQPDATSLAQYAFANNKFLKRVENAKAWNEGYAFYGSSVEEIVCSENWIYLSQNDFADDPETTAIRSITLSAKLDSHVGNAVIFKGLDKLEEILVPEENTMYFSEDGVLYFTSDKQKATYLLLYPNARPGEEFTPSEEADGIYYVERAFENPLYLKKIHAGNMNLSGAKFPNGIEIVTP